MSAHPEPSVPYRAPKCCPQSALPPAQPQGHTSSYFSRGSRAGLQRGLISPGFM
jgi:hypothetical protein